MPLDPRMLTGPALMIIGALLLTIALRLWLVRPLNRVFRIGPFVTDLGLRALLRMRVMFFAIGMFMVTQGMSSFLYWFIAGRDVTWWPVLLLGSTAAGFAVWAAALSISAALRLWRAK